MKSGTFFSKRSGLLQRNLSLVNFVLCGIFQFKCSFVFSGIVCMYVKKKSRNFVGTVYPFGVYLHVCTGKTKELISCAVNVQLICAFVITYANKGFLATRLML